MRKRFSMFCCAMLALNLMGCSNSSDGKDSAFTGTDTQQEVISVEIDPSEMFSDRDLKADYQLDSCVKIQLNGDVAQCDSDGVNVDGSTVTIEKEGTYLVSGTLTNGSIKVDTDKEAKVQIVLDAVSIQNDSSAALYVKQADKVFLTLAENTENTLSTKGEFVAIDDNNIDGAIYSKEDLTINGKGKLTITSPQGHGIVGKDDMVLAGGEYSIEAGSHGISGKDSVRIATGSFQIYSGKDGIQAENEEEATAGYIYIADGSFSIQAQGDGISAGNTLYIEKGSYDICAGSEKVIFAEVDVSHENGKETVSGDGINNENKQVTSTESDVSNKGIKAAGNMVLNNGSYKVVSLDDAFHSNGNVELFDGSYTIATGDDGMHADGNLKIHKGTVQITESYEGLEGQSIDLLDGEITIVSKDDGLNAAGGNDQSGTQGNREQDRFFRDNKKGGQRLEQTEGNKTPQKRNEQQDGQEGISNGEMPNFGDGERPEFPDGEMPDFGDVERPEFPNGENTEKNSESFFGNKGMGGGKGGMFDVDENAYINISGGTLTIDAQGDGIDSNGTLTVTGGVLLVNGPSNGGNAALDSGSTKLISGGTVMATCMQSMAENFDSDSTQGAMLVTCGSQEAGSKISLKDEDGKTLLSWEATKSYDCVIVSCGDIQQGNTYTLEAGTFSERIEMSSITYGNGSFMHGGMGRKERN